MINLDKTSAIILPLSLAIGMIGGSALLGYAIKQSRNADSFVTVRGVAERNVRADLVVWPIKVQASGDDLSTVNKKADEARIKALRFLSENGIKDIDIASQTSQVVDRQVDNYSNAKAAVRYVAEYTILVRSMNVDVIQKTSQLTEKLASVGVVLSPQSRPKYLYTQLNVIKPSMLSEATRAAREVAKQLAIDSGANVGLVKKANQGLFSITDRDAIAYGDSETNTSSGDQEVNKKVRVVVTIDYFLDQ